MSEIVRPGEGSPFEQVFSYGDRPVRVIEINGQPWFVALDVCAVLDIRNSRDAVGGLDEDERGVATTDTPGGQQEVVIVNEAGLYSLIFRSRKASAKRFKRWVTHEVLPAIRRGGSYSVASTAQKDELDLIIAAAVEMRKMRDEVREIAAAAVEAGQDARVANARIDAIEGRHDWFSALGYAKTHHMPTDSMSLARFGKLAATIGRSEGVEPNKVQHAHYGVVNEFPVHVWDRAASALRGGAA